MTNQIKSYEATEISKMPEMARTLKEHILEHRLYTSISSKNYVHVDGWSFAGAMLGLLPVVKEVRDLSTDKEVKWLAHVEIVDKTGRVVGTGFATCSNKETRKKSFDEYAVLSMAQTRAIGKAYRNIIGWVIKLAGYETTPSEEMKTDASQPITMTDEPIIQTEAPHRECSECAAIITEKEYAFSKRLHKRALCRECQPKKK